MANEKMTRFELAAWTVEQAGATDNDALKAAAAAFLASEEKKRNRAKNAPKTESKEKKQNRAKCIEIMRAIVTAGNEPRNADWIGHHVDYVDTAHKVTGKMNIGRANGWVDYGPNDKGRRTWYVTDAGIAYLNGEDTPEA